FDNRNLAATSAVITLACSSQRTRSRPSRSHSTGTSLGEAILLRKSSAKWPPTKKGGGRCGIKTPRETFFPSNRKNFSKGVTFRCNLYRLILTVTRTGRNPPGQILRKQFGGPDELGSREIP